MHTHTPFSATPQAEIRRGTQQAPRRATYHFKTVFSLPTGKQTFFPQVLPRVLPAPRRDASGRHRNERSPATAPSRGRHAFLGPRQGTRSGGSHFSSPTITQTPVPRVDTLQPRRSATLVTRATKPGTQPSAGALKL